MHSYKDCKIPVDWMLDSGIISKVPFTCMNSLRELRITLSYCRYSFCLEGVPSQFMCFPGDGNHICKLLDLPRVECPI